ncbi:MAG: Stp1/IreP family PP2C-type Ser/Thr phosphatase [Ruminococcus sp.]|nr:Stp1/IreP family PP2C-type Ser/Thr phosphatase [Candidatus Copronaster equi]
MIISAKTHIGKIRSSNQDAYACGEFAPNVAWAAVCDGMGGAKAGNVASETAAKVISEKIKLGYREGMSDSTMKNLLVSAIEAANATVFSMAEKNEDFYGMGTTVVLAFVKEDELYIAHAGDSRIYSVSDAEIRQLTRDHSFVQMMIDNGEITPEEAKIHPKKNVITRALGIEPEVLIDYAQETFNKGDTILLCSDGLTNFVDDDKIKEICNSSDKKTIAETLVDLANENGGGDNVTVVAVSEQSE